MNFKTYLGIFSGPLSFLIIQSMTIPGLEEEPQAVLATAVWMAIWWVS